MRNIFICRDAEDAASQMCNANGCSYHEVMQPGSPNLTGDACKRRHKEANNESLERKQITGNVMAKPEMLIEWVA